MCIFAKKPDMRIYLIGFMGCGKSTFGKRLAKKLDYSFIDMDAVIEEKAGKDIVQIFEEDGEHEFRRLEKETLYETLKIEKCVIATGGGTPCSDDHMDFINQNGVSVYLRMSPLSIAHRLENAKKQRPLTKGKKGDVLLEYIKEKLYVREKYYMQSHCIIKGETVKPDQVISLIFG